MVHYCRLNVHDKCIRVAAAPGGDAGRLPAYLAISIHPSLSSLCTTNYRFAKLTFLWWNNGVAGADGEEDVRRKAARRTRNARAESEEGQFDVNRSIVIRVNRLSAPDGLPNTICDLYCSILFPEWSSRHHRGGNIYDRYEKFDLRQ